MLTKIKDIKVVGKQLVKTNKKNNILTNLIQNNKAEDLTISFSHYDGSKRTLNINKSFFYDENDKKLKTFEIIKKFNTLKHDLNAYKFTLKKI